MADSAPASRRLDSWKQIGLYLGRDVRTVMRWSRIDGLPVHRIAGAKGRSVFAFTDEIDAWLARQAMVPPFDPPASAEPPAVSAPPVTARPAVGRWWRVILVTFVVIVVTLVVGPFRVTAPAEIARARLDGQTLVAVDVQGRELWRQSVPDLLSDALPAHAVLVADLTGDGRPDIAVMGSLVDGAGGRSGAVLVFDASGALLWKRQFDDRVAFGGVDYGPPWFPDVMAPFRVGGRHRLAVAVHHHVWWPDLVLVFDADGAKVSRFVNAGWIYGLAATSDGRHLLASGVSNAQGGSMLTVLDAERVEGVSPPEGGRLPPCDSCGDGRPERYFVAPWSDIAFPSESPKTLAFVQSSGDIEWHMMQRTQPATAVPELIAVLSPEFTLRTRAASDSFRAEHERRERAGELQHPFAQCPWREPPLREWTPAGGWRELR